MKSYSIFLLFILLNLVPGEAVFSRDINPADPQACTSENANIALLSVAKLKQWLDKESQDHDQRDLTNADYLKVLKKIYALSSLQLESIKSKADRQLDEIALQELTKQIEKQVEFVLGQQVAGETIRRWKSSINAEQQGELVEEFKKAEADLSRESPVTALTCVDPQGGTQWNFEIKQDKRQVRFSVKIDDKTYSSEKFINVSSGNIEEHEFKVGENERRMIMFDISSGLRATEIGQMINFEEEVRKASTGENSAVFLAMIALTQRFFPPAKDHSTFPLGISFQLELKEEKPLSDFDQRLADEFKRNTGRELFAPDSFIFIRRAVVGGNYEEFLPKEMVDQILNDKDRKKQTLAKRAAEEKIQNALQSLAPTIIMQCKEKK